MLTRCTLLMALVASPAFCGDWNPRLAAQYLDSRQKEWFAWPAANSNGVPCVSCHTGVTYLLARPALSRALGESGRTPYETGLLDGMRSRLARKDSAELFPKATPPHSTEALGVETVFSALFLAAEDARRGKLSADTEKAFDRLWSLQIRDGKAKGSWDWNSYDLDPWEMPESAFYGAALAAVAAGMAPGGYQSRADVRENLAALIAYLRNQEASQPLHNRIMLLWAAAKLPGVLADSRRQAAIDELWQKQQPDGGWTIESLGPWKPHADALPAGGSNAYATALVAFTVQQAGIPRSTESLERALDWLRAHQDPKLGCWPADSMNKRRRADSMPARFMQDAATGYAALALIGMVIGTPGTVIGTSATGQPAAR